MKISHIGYAVKDINAAKQIFQILGYSIDNTVFDKSRNVFISFANKDGISLEIISSGGGGKNPIDLLLTKNGPMPYHLCYDVVSIKDTITELKKSKFILLDDPSVAVALDNDIVAFLYNKHIGLIELREKK